MAAGNLASTPSLMAARGPGVTTAAALAVAASVLSACTPSSSTPLSSTLSSSRPSSSTLSSSTTLSQAQAGTPSPAPPVVRGAATLPPPVTQGTGTPDGGFDCAAVARARMDLDAAIGAELHRLGVSVNAAAAFDVTLVVTARHSHVYWDAALVQVPPDLAGAAGRIREHWRLLDPAVRGIVLDGASPAALDEAMRRLEAVTGPPDGGVAADEHLAQARLDAACPGSRG